MKNAKTNGFTKLNMDILVFEHVKLGSGWRAEGLRSPFTRIYLVTKGEGELRFGEERVRMLPGNVYVIPAGVTFSYGCKDGFEKTYFHISVRHPSGYDILSTLHHHLIFPDEEGARLVRECLGADTAGKVLRIKAYLYSLICTCMERAEGEIPLVGYSDYVTEVMAYIEKNLSASLTVKEMADALYTSPGRLRKTFRTETGRSVGRYITDRVLQVAELEVRRGELSVKEISEKLGFCDQFYFSRCFTKQYGISPLRYRKKLLYQK